MRQICGILLLTLLSITIDAQTTSIIIKSTNQTNFRVTINKIIQHNNFVNNIKIDSLFGERAYRVKIKLANDTATIKQQIYLIDEGLTQIYLLKNKQLQLKKIVPSATLKSKNNNQLLVVFTKNPVTVIKEQKKDTVKPDSLITKIFKNHFNMPNYKGKIGCPWPVKNAELNAIKNEIKQKNFEDDKLAIAKEKVQDLDSACFAINQLREILYLFEYEETKLDFAKFIAPSIFDIDNINQLKDVFNFESSIEELNKYIENK